MKDERGNMKNIWNKQEWDGMAPMDMAWILLKTRAGKNKFNRVDAEEMRKNGRRF